MIRSTAKLLHPDTLDVEITISMQLAEWDRLLLQMEQKYPNEALRSNLQSALAKFRDTVLQLDEIDE